MCYQQVHIYVTILTEDSCYATLLLAHARCYLTFPIQSLRIYNECFGVWTPRQLESKSGKRAEQSTINFSTIFTNLSNKALNFFHHTCPICYPNYVSRFFFLFQFFLLFYALYKDIQWTNVICNSSCYSSVNLYQCPPLLCNNNSP